MKLTYKLTLAFLIGALFVTLFTLLQRPWEALGSVEVGQEYNATTTPITAETRILKTSGGQLGSVVITKSDTGTLSLYNATTSDITKRNNVATTTLLIAHFPASPTVGTYQFDASASNGLLMVVTAGAASSTITWK